MPRNCCVPNCKTGYDTNDKTKYSMFAMPKSSEIREMWIRNIPRVEKEGGFSFSSPHVFVCQKHFKDEEVQTSDDFIINGKKISLSREMPRLLKNAVPSIFPTLPSCMSTTTTSERSKSPKRASPKKRPTSYDLEMEVADVYDGTVNAEYIEIEQENMETQYMEVKQEIMESPIPMTEDVYDFPYHSELIIKDELENVCASEIESDKRIEDNSLYCLDEKSTSNPDERIAAIEGNNSAIEARIGEFEENEDNLNAAIAQNLSDRQFSIVNQIMRLGSCKDEIEMTYDSDWIMDCIILRIRSEKNYEFLRINRYLPLPDIQTLERYISNMDCAFGFDVDLFDRLQEKLSGKPDKVRDGILQWGTTPLEIHKQMNNRSSVDKHLFSASKEFNEGDCGLVFVFKSFSGSWEQTIGTFFSEEEICNEFLARLIVKVIVGLEHSGARVCIVGCDGSVASRSVLGMFGVSGEKNAVTCCFENPAALDRKIFAIIDIPCLWKYIWTSLMEQKFFKHPHGIVDIQHYKELLCAELMQKSKPRIELKLQEAYIHPNNYQKMSLRLATELFSEPVANALEYYQDIGTVGLKDADYSIVFTHRWNRLYNALSRLTTEGAKKNSEDLHIISDTLSWMDRWENYTESQPTQMQENFLSKKTTTSLRISLNSVYQLLQNISNFEEYKYGLTDIFKQDLLLRFFGMTRQAAARDMNLTDVQFLYLHRLTSVHSLVCPAYPVKLDRLNVLKTMQEIGKAKPVLDLKNLEMIFDNPNSIQVLGANSLFKNPATNFIINFIGAYIVCRLVNNKCEACTSSLRDSDTTCQKDVDIEIKKRFKYPSTRVSKLLKFAENHVYRNLADLSTVSNVYDNVTNDIFGDGNLPSLQVGCDDDNHCVMLTTCLLHFYITLRIHFFRTQKTRIGFKRSNKGNIKVCP